ncbi:MAG TPA: hypothetical protein VJ810_42485, partial [Blastocatellia bacterium]|nr:hypothetical protein [Blastocatellia bacterium]
RNKFSLSPLPGLGTLLELFPVVPPPANIHRASGTKSCVETNARPACATLAIGFHNFRASQRDMKAP